MQYTKRIWLSVVVGALVVVGLIGTSTSALSAGSHSTPFVSDPRDTGGMLDLRAGRTIVGSELCRATISTWGSWKSTILQGGNYAPGKNKLEVLYNLSGDNKVDLRGYFISERGVIYLWSRTASGNFAPVPAPRLSSSSVTVSLCRFLLELESSPKVVRVAFLSVNGTHHDRMPNSGWVTLHTPLVQLVPHLLTANR
jgi:hypothetical protein